MGKFSSPEEGAASGDLSNLTLYEKKCVLINREIDAIGMGYYQWLVWGLCGFGYLIDLLWAQAFGLALSPLQQEFGFGSGQTGNISSSFSAGLTAGAFFWGVLADIIGRRWAFNLTVLISSAFGLGLGASDNYTTFLVLTAFVGFGVGGNIPIDTTIMLEFIPQNKHFLLAVLSLFQPVGVVICSAIAFGFIPTKSCSPNFSEPGALPSCFQEDLEPGVACCSRESNMGWRYFLYTLGAITLFVFFLRAVIFRLKESPKFLIYQDRDAEAIEVVQHIAKKNGRSCNLTLEDFERLTGEDDSIGSASTNSSGKTKQLVLTRKEQVFAAINKYSVLFSGWQMARLTILVWLTYIFDFWGFTVAGTYLPQILALKNGSASKSLQFTYASYIYTYAPGILGVILGALMYRIPSIGRKWTMVLASGLMGASIFLFAVVDTVPKNLGLFTLEYFFQSMFNAVLYGWTPEAFPASVRGGACGIASFWGRLFGIVSPLIAQKLYATSTDGNSGVGGNINTVLYLAGGITFGCVITTSLLPSKKLSSTEERS
ncbi:membrane transporter [Xylaria bambusicola]|uniref:membrane transporter n=1 Tax=Xylaria bambusicola TaxID=326684 RepID=UPI002008749A|nr:membrane transporter [Xylaria bambusicola]KAI0513188.1 membrane transporter [Xylaria bambusicola]